MWPVKGLIRCEIEREAKIETIYCSSTASQRMPSSRTTPRNLRLFGRKQETKKQERMDKYG
jgi:bisphosphoglycerate-dependent phosphoglycerate mutase